MRHARDTARHSMCLHSMTDSGETHSPDQSRRPRMHRCIDWTARAWPQHCCWRLPLPLPRLPHAQQRPLVARQFAAPAAPAAAAATGFCRSAGRTGSWAGAGTGAPDGFFCFLAVNEALRSSAEDDVLSGALRLVATAGAGTTETLEAPPTARLATPALSPPFACRSVISACDQSTEHRKGVRASGADCLRYFINRRNRRHNAWTV